MISSSGNSSDTGGTILVNPFADVQLLPVTSSATSSPLHQISSNHHKPEMKFGSLRSSSVSGLTGSCGPSKLFSNRSNSARAAKMRDIAKQIEQMRIIHNQRSEAHASEKSSNSPATTVNTTSGHSTTTTTSGPNSSGSTSPSNSAIQAPPVEQLQQQVQIRDLKTISMNTSSNISTTTDCSRNPDHHPMLAKLQNVMNTEKSANGAVLLNRSSPKQRKV